MAQLQSQPVASVCLRRRMRRLCSKGPGWVEPRLGVRLASMRCVGAAVERAALFQDDLPDGRKRMRHQIGSVGASRTRSARLALIMDAISARSVLPRAKRSCRSWLISQCKQSDIFSPLWPRVGSGRCEAPV